MSPKTTGNIIYSDDLLKHAVDVALYYGFLPLSRVKAETIKSKLKKARRIHVSRSSLDMYNQELHSALSEYMDYGFGALPKPVLFYLSNLEHKKKPNKNEPVLISLQAIGSEKSIAEALVIKAAIDILKDMRVGEICIHVNTIGDKNSVLKYIRELSVYFRKYIAIS